MRTYEEKNTIEFKGDYDVIVVGGGVSGVAAALAAARNGMRVLIIEKTICLGGQATLGHVVLYVPMDDGYGNQVIGGISEELLKKSILYGYDNLPRVWKDKLKIEDQKKDDPETWGNLNPDLRCQTFFNAPAFALALDEAIEQAGVEVMFDTVFCNTIMDGNICTGLIVENKSGRFAYSSRVVVDASGDADVLYRAGATCSDFDNFLTYICYDIDFERMQNAIDNNNMYRAIPDWLMLGYDPLDGSGKSVKKYYATSVEGVNDFVRDSRKIGLSHLKNNIRADYTMLSMPTVASFRMTRRIDGMYLLTEDDFNKEFEDSIGMTGDWRKAGPVIEVPYRSMIDSKVTNVIAAGRIIATEPLVWELTRCIPQVAFIGEAAGLAAVQAVRNEKALQEISVPELQKAIMKNGGILHHDQKR